MRRAAVGGLVILLASTSSLSAQLSAGARSVGMGGGGMVFASGVDAVEWNPANLGWAQGWNIALVESGLGTTSSGATFGGIMSIFDVELPGLGGASAADAIAGIPDEGIHMYSASEGFSTSFAADGIGIPTPARPLPTIGVSIGSVAVRIRSRAMSDVAVSRELADLIGNGFDPVRIQEYAVGHTAWSSTWLTEFTAAWGVTVGESLSVGVGGRYVRGQGMVYGRFFEPEIDLLNASLSVESVAVESPGGSGFGLDMGLALELPAGFRASASGTNVFQRMSWDDALIAHTARYTDEDFTDGRDLSELIDEFDAQAVDPTSASLAVYQASQGLFDQNFYPQVVRGGLGWRSGGTSIEAVGIRVSPRGRFTSSWDQRVSLGVEQRLPVVTLRAGYAMGGDGLRAYTGGLGLGVGPVVLEGSAGVFSGTSSADFAREDFYATIALQLKGGGR